MPDQSEIAAAEDRLRRYNAGEPAHLIWSTLESDWKIADERMRQDTDTLAAAYLDELAKTKPIRQLKPRKIELDDEDADEPVTREWLVGVLGEPAAKNAINWDWVNGYDAIRHSTTSGLLGQLGDGTRFTVSFPVKTRDGLLAFCGMAGWPLKGADNGN